MTKLNLLWSRVQTIIQKINKPAVYIAAIIILILFNLNTCNNNNNLDKQLVESGNTINNLNFKNKVLKTSDSTHALEVQAITVKNAKDVANLRDSMSIALSRAAKLDKEIAILKYKVSIKPDVPNINIDSISQAITDSLKKLPCDSLKALADSNHLLYIPAHLEPMITKWYEFKGNITRDKNGKVGVDFDKGYPKFNLEPTIVLGEKRSWFLGKWKTTAVIGDNNPYADISEGKYIQLRNKERKFGVTLGYGLLYDFRTKQIVNGPSVSFGFRF